MSSDRSLVAALPVGGRREIWSGEMAMSRGQKHSTAEPGDTEQQDVLKLDGLDFTSLKAFVEKKVSLHITNRPRFYIDEKGNPRSIKPMGRKIAEGINRTVNFNLQDLILALHEKGLLDDRAGELLSIIDSLSPKNLAHKVFDTDPPLPRIAPELFQDRTDKSEDAPQFIKRVYGKYLGRGLTRHELGDLDKQLMNRFYNWIKKPENRASFDLDLPTSHTYKRSWAQRVRAGEEQAPTVADAKTLNRNAARLKRAEKEEKNSR